MTNSKNIIPKQVLELLDDVPGGSIGMNVEDGEGSQEGFAIFTKLSNEVDKFDGYDYEKIILWSQELLKNHFKHIKLAIWLFRAWLVNDGFDGLKNGLFLLNGLLDKYKTEIFPANPEWIGMTISQINQAAYINALNTIDLSNVDKEGLEEVEVLFKSFQNKCDTLLKEFSPDFDDFADILNTKINEIKSEEQQKENNKEEEKRKREEELRKQREEEEKRKREENQKKQKEEEKKKTNQKQETNNKTISNNDEPQVKPINVTQDQNSTEDNKNDTPDVMSDSQCINFIKKTLRRHCQKKNKLEDNNYNDSDSSIYVLSRSIVWGDLSLFNSSKKNIDINPPDIELRKNIEDLVKSGEDNKLINIIEYNFLNSESFKYWFDGQRYQINAFAKRESETGDTISKIKFELAKMLFRFEGIEELHYADGTTPLANKETRDWLINEVKSILSPAKSINKIGSDIPWENYQEITDFYNKALTELPEKFEENVKEMRDKMEKEETKKARFLWMLSLAQLCYSSEKYSIAKVLLNQLMAQIDEYNLYFWETALCTNVWQSFYLTNVQILKNTNNEEQKSEITEQQKELYEKIAKNDAWIAINLDKKEH